MSSILGGFQAASISAHSPAAALSSPAHTQEESPNRQLGTGFTHPPRTLPAFINEGSVDRAHIGLRSGSAWEPLIIIIYHCRLCVSLHITRVLVNASISEPVGPEVVHTLERFVRLNLFNLTQIHFIFAVISVFLAADIARCLLIFTQ